MWNQALRRIVHTEERQQEERRRQQLAEASSYVSSVSNATTLSSYVSVEATQSTLEDKEVVSERRLATCNDNNKALKPTDRVASIEKEGQVKAYDDCQQKHLLSRPTSSWSCLEDTQQANCLALNTCQTLLAVGERDGRISIWDNTTIRVITRELDPTLIALPILESTKGIDTLTIQGEDRVKPMKRKEMPTTKISGDTEGLMKNEDVSIEDKVEEKTDDAVSIEKDVVTEKDEEADDNEDNACNKSEDKKACDDASTVEGGAVLTMADLQVAKTALKVVSQCCWSCDSRWLFAGCEEKSTRRARLCVWNVDAATLVSAFQFDGTITSLSAHPCDPKLVIVSYWNSRPVLLDVISGQRTELENVPLENAEITQSTAQSNSRHPMLATCAQYGHSGKRIYCATSKSILAVLDAATLQCLDSLKLNVAIQFVDLCVNLRETAMLLTSSKGIHEFVVESVAKTANATDDLDAKCVTATKEHPLGLCEVTLHSTGAVRAPWAVCCFSGDEEFVVGIPVVRHRHIGENGLFTWHRASNLGKTTAQHNVGIKDGVLALTWDRLRQSVLAVSTSGALHVLEENFTTAWPGAMYPAGFRLITENELHLEVFDRDLEEQKRKKEKLAEAAKHTPVDVFTVKSPHSEFPSECDAAVAPNAKRLADKLCYIPAIPIAHYHRQHLHQLHGEAYDEDRLFGLGQSVFKPLRDGVGDQKRSNGRKSRNGDISNRGQKRRRK